MKLTFVEKKTEVAGVESFIFKPEEPLTFTAGQFLHYVLPHDEVDERGTERWFTIASAPSESEIVITTRIASEKGSSFKKALCALHEGDVIEADGPKGQFTLTDGQEQHVFIAGGIGVTPFYSMLKELDHDGGKDNITLLYANRDENVPYKSELATFVANNPNLQIHYITSPEQIDEKKIKAMVPELEQSIFYVSGPEGMVESLDSTLKEMGVPEDHIKQDYFPGYQNI